MRSRGYIYLLLALATLVAASMLTVACERAAEPPPQPVRVTPATTPAVKPDSPAVIAAPVPATREVSPSPTMPTAASTPGPTPRTSASVAPPSPTTPSEPPQEGISGNAWTRDRIASTQAIWSFTELGREWMGGYDFRQMIGRPAWYGSHGAGGWAGAGEANPRIVLHELSHSWWGAFPVEGRPDLTWERVDGAISTALSQFHADVELFLRQPPDSFEPLRDRFRNLTNLSRGEYSDLKHFSEAEIVNMTGGNLSLIPPILRKYFSPFLAPEGVAAAQVVDWPSAIGWFRALPEEQSRIAKEVFGLQHFPQHLYQDVPALAEAALDAHIVNAFQTEERQRLMDFAEQFDLVKGSSSAVYDAADVNRGFSFWRGYLSDKKQLHKLYPDVLGNHPSAAARELGAAFDFYIGLDDAAPESQATAVAERLDEPAIREFAVLLKPRAIVELFSGGAGSDVIDKAISERAEKLAEIARRVDEIVAAARASEAVGAARLEDYLDSLSDDTLRSDLNITADLIRETDGDVASRIFPLLSDATLRRLIAVKPDQARAPEIGEARLLAAVGVTVDASAESITSGARLLTENSSGNFAIDRSYNEAVFDVIETLAASDPAAAIAALGESGMRLRPWIHRRTQGALEMIRREMNLAAGLLAAASGPRETPEGLLHELIDHDPEIAAALLVEMENQGVENIAQRTLMTLAFDAYWTDWGGVVGVDPALDGRFLVELTRLRGAEWVEIRFRQAVRQVRIDIEANEADPQFIAQLRRTLTEALGLSRQSMASDLLALIDN